MSGLTVTVRYQDSNKEYITLGELLGGDRKIGETFDSYWFIRDNFLRSIPQSAMSIIAEGRKNNSYDGSIQYSLKTRNEVLEILSRKGRIYRLLAGANPANDEMISHYWVSDQSPPTISPDLRPTS